MARKKVIQKKVTKTRVRKAPAKKQQQEDNKKMQIRCRDCDKRIVKMNSPYFGVCPGCKTAHIIEIRKVGEPLPKAGMRCTYKFGKHLPQGSSYLEETI